MKKLIPILIAFLLMAYPVYAVVSPYITIQGGTGTTTPSGILYGDNGATGHLNTVKIGTNLTFTGGTLNATGGSGGSGTVGTSTNEIAGYLSYWSSNSGTPALLGKVSTTTATCTGSTSCSPFTVIGSSPITINSTGGGTNYFSNSALNTFLNTGTFLQAPALVATSTTATSTIANFSGVLDATAFPGSDIWAQAQNAYNALPTTGGTIKIPPGNYSFSSQFNAGVNGKGVSILCDPGGATVLTYTGNSTSTIFNFGQGNGNSGQSISFCHFIGSGTTTASVAIQLGGSNGNKNFTVDNVEVRNFGKPGAIVTQANTYVPTFLNDFVHHNGKAFSYQSSSNAGERLNFISGVWADCQQATGGDATNCIDFSTFGASDVNFTNVSFDDAQLHFGSGTRKVTIIGGHIENPAADFIAAYTPIVIDSSASTNVSIDGTTFVNGANTSRPAQWISNGGTLTVSGVTTEDYGAGTHNIANFVTNTGNGWTKVFSINKQDTSYLNLWNSTGGTGNIQYAMEDNGNLGIGTGSPDNLIAVGSGVNSTGFLPGISVTGATSDRFISVGQDGTHNIQTAWHYNGTAGNAFATVETFGGNNNLTLQSSGGNVGISTTSPAVKLDVKGSIVSEEAKLTSSATPTIDWSTSNQIQMTLTANVTSLTFTNGQRGSGYRLVLCQDGTGSRTLAGWDSKILWAGGTTPTQTATANKCDVYTFTTTFATTTGLKYFGGYVQNF